MFDHLVGEVFDKVLNYLLIFNLCDGMHSLPRNAECVIGSRIINVMAGYLIPHATKLFANMTQNSYGCRFQTFAASSTVEPLGKHA